MKIFKLDFKRADAEIIKAFAKIPTPTISDAMGRCGAMSSDMKPVSCDGVPVFPGDIIVGDSDGVVVAPLEQARVVLEKARAILDREDQLRERIEKGELIFDILELEKYFSD